ncbi:formimidoylglutamate deiminase [Emcibacter sp.]|uniref:formimidoylglutamate deiminase n=1 Tax=Emcibacter sp. TaxID=1979954 RepID=UPI003A91CE58
MTDTSNFLISKAYVDGHWQDNLLLEVDSAGLIQRLDPYDGREDVEKIAGFVLPPMVNVHSHAFQRAMAGRAEYASSREDSFWTWREVMYRCAGQMTPEGLYHIARQLYLEMLKGGYGAVCEFHYLHHHQDGMPYDNPAEMSLALMRAAEDVGIAICHLPVLYMAGGFGGAPLSEGQKRFQHTPDGYQSFWRVLEKECGPNQSLGLAFHSLRAVPVDVIREFEDFAPTAPRHIHIAEQQKEVEDCLIHSGRRPVELLMDHVELNEKWCLVHATHLDDGEARALAHSRAVAGLCPTTEANLGDGLFPLETYLGRGGQIAIGSDSHVSRDMREELRWLEYGQRLKAGRRTVSANKKSPHCGSRLFDACLEGGAKVSGFHTGKLAPGYRADLMVLKEDNLTLAGLPDEQLLDGFIFNSGEPMIEGVMVGGKWVLKDGRHPQEDDINRDFRQVMDGLLADQVTNA